MHAAVETILWATAINPDVRVQIIVDNTAVAGALRRMYTSNSVAMDMILKLENAPHVITVPSKLNVADAPSRDEEIDLLVANECFKAFAADREGKKLGKAEPFTGKEVLRHVEPEDDEVSGKIGTHFNTSQKFCDEKKVEEMMLNLILSN